MDAKITYYFSANTIKIPTKELFRMNYPAYFILNFTY